VGGEFFCLRGARLQQLGRFIHAWSIRIEAHRRQASSKDGHSRRPDPPFPDVLSPLCSHIADNNSRQLKLRTHQPPAASPDAHIRKKCPAEC
jgi:hypothetical protein